jgi:hypothetical protein
MFLVIFLSPGNPLTPRIPRRLNGMGIGAGLPYNSKFVTEARAGQPTTAQAAFRQSRPGAMDFHSKSSRPALFAAAQ